MQADKSSKAEDSDARRITAVRYGVGTDEDRILHSHLPEPGPRVRRADAHRPRPREIFRNVAVSTLNESWAALRLRQQRLQFHHSPLGKGEIRILRLYQAKHPDDPLKADLLSRKLEDIKGRYEALSYCWGSGGETHEIQIRDLNATGLVPDAEKDAGESTEPKSIKTNILVRTVGAITHTEFKIRKNLHQALHRLRSKYRDAYLWVDAICIDQSEKGAAEKVEQLAMMARIYNYAANVCVWLGEDYEAVGVTSAFSLIKEIMNYKNFDVMIRDPSHATALKQLVAILRADWFSRRWIIQEIALSREASIHCGAQSLHWDDFADAVSLLTEKIELMRTEYHFRDETFEDVETSSASTLIQTLGNICRKSDFAEDKGKLDSRLLDVETLVSTLLGFQASFARDTIYSILSLAKDSPRIQEPWSQKHEEQLKKNKQEKLERIKKDLSRYKEYGAKLEADREKERPLQEEREKHLARLQDIRQRRHEARNKDKRLEVWKLTMIIDNMHEPELEKQDRRFKELEADLHETKTRIRELGKEQDQVDQEEARINLLPNYQLSPRDLFIAFVTRSVYQSKSLDIICRHWAPELKPDEGSGQMPSWISCITNAPFGVPGTSQGRQAGDNLVAYLPHDQRKRYSASGTTTADFSMRIDPLVSLPTGSSTTEDLPVDQDPEIKTPPGPADTESASPQSEKGKNPTTSSPPDLLSAPIAAAHDAIVDNQDDSASTVQRHRSIFQTARDQTKKVRAALKRSKDDRAPDSGGDTPETSAVGTPDHTATPRAEDREAGPAVEAVNPSKEPSPPPLKQNRPPSTTKNIIRERFAQVAEKTSGEAADDAKEVAPSEGQFRGRPDAVLRGKAMRKKQLEEKMMPPAALHRLSGILVVRGFVLGVIHDQSDVMRGGIVPGGWVSRLGWERRKNLENRVPETLWRLLVADRTPQGGRPPPWYKRACLHGLVDSRVPDNAGNIHPVSPSDRKISELTTNYFKRVASVVWNRRILELVPSGSELEHEDGGQRQEPATRPLYGLGPEGCSKGDYVCILYGCSVPVVLKVVPEAAQPRVPGLFEVVGEAYVHGVMDGEAMPADRHDLEKWEVDFCLG